MVGANCIGAQEEKTMDLLNQILATKMPEKKKEKRASIPEFTLNSRTKQLLEAMCDYEVWDTRKAKKHFGWEHGAASGAIRTLAKKGHIEKVGEITEGPNTMFLYRKINTLCPTNGECSPSKV